MNTEPNTNTGLNKVIDVGVNSLMPFDENKTLKDLYNQKKEYLKLSDRQIQKILGMDKNTLNPILNGEAKQINMVNVLKLSHFLGLSVNDILKIVVPEMDSKLIGEIQRAKDAGYIVEYFDIGTLSKQKFFKTDASADEMSERIKKFFNLESLYDYTNSVLPLFSRTKRNSSDLMRNFWVRSALVQFEEIANPNPYNRQELIQLMPKIRPFTRDVEYGLTKVLKALFNVGLTVIFQPSIAKIQVRGATMVVNGKPCIVLSDFKKYYPTLWFTLLHELHHVLYDIEEIEKRKFHISSGEGDLFLMNEEKADNFATEYLLNDSRLKYASNYINSNLHIEKLAKTWGVHSSIIYVIYCYKNNKWAYYNKFIPKMDDAIKLLNTHPFEKETLIESATKLKELIYN